MSNTQQEQKYYVINRNGEKEEMNLQKIHDRISSLCKKFSINVNINKLIDDVKKKAEDNIKTSQLDLFAARLAQDNYIYDIDYGKLAGVLMVDNMHKNNKRNFLETSELLFKKGRLDAGYYTFILNNKKIIMDTIDYSRDYYLNFFAIEALWKSYLLGYYEEDDKKYENLIRAEKPQDLWMRVSLAIYYKTDEIEKAMKCYENLSKLYFIQASPTNYNAGTCRDQRASCFLLGVEDSLKGILKTRNDAAVINKWAGGVGISISDIRAAGSLIKGTYGLSTGIPPMLRDYNKLVEYINQGGKRNGAIAFYLEPWHSDIFEFLDLKRPDGNSEQRARNLFYGLWINDLFMRRVKSGGKWSLMSPDISKGLTSVYGQEFDELYEKYEKEGKYVRQIDAIDLWKKILKVQQLTGTPYMLFKDASNEKSNQKNLGTIKCSNLCTEIIQYSDENNHAVCNLASICLPKFVEFDEKNIPSFNYKKLVEIAQLVTENLDNNIDVSFYPTKEARNSNIATRPLGVGVQGLADVFCLFDISFDSEEARLLNKKIFETIYYGCLTKSVELAKSRGKYQKFKGSPFSQGKLQYHLWGMKNSDLLTYKMWDWDSLVHDVKKYGTRNSQLTTCMPTASTSHIMGNNECIEPFFEILFVKSTLVGDTLCVNKHLIEKLKKENLLTDKMRIQLIKSGGSIQNIPEIPDKIKAVYKTAFEIKMKPLIDLSVDRAPFIDQSQSLNLFANDLNETKLSSCHFYSWQKGLKTGMYYLRVRLDTTPLDFGKNKLEDEEVEKEEVKEVYCPYKKKGSENIDCESCQ